MSNTKRILVAIGVLVAIIALSVFMFTASSTLFSFLAGTGAVAVILIYDEYRNLASKMENNTLISDQSYRLYKKLKEDYKENHPEDKFFDP